MYYDEVWGFSCADGHLIERFYYNNIIICEHEPTDAEIFKEAIPIVKDY